MNNKFAVAIAATLASLGAGLPVVAQEPIQVPETVEPPAIIDQDRLLDDEVGLPDGVEDTEGTGLPNAGEVLDDNVLILENGDVTTPRSVEGVNGGRVYTDPNPGANVDLEPEASPVETGQDGGMVIYPPADSVEDLEPEDILQ